MTKKQTEIVSEHAGKTIKKGIKKGGNVDQKVTLSFAIKNLICYRNCPKSGRYFHVKFVEILFVIGSVKMSKVLKEGRCFSCS